MDFIMNELDLTEAQREGQAPIGTKGYYRMYRWECQIAGCRKLGRKMTNSKALRYGLLHEKNAHGRHGGKTVNIRGGVFPKSQFGEY